MISLRRPECLPEPLFPGALRGSVNPSSLPTTCEPSSQQRSLPGEANRPDQRRSRLNSSINFPFSCLNCPAT